MARMICDRFEPLQFLGALGALLGLIGFTGFIGSRVQGL